MRRLHPVGPNEKFVAQGAYRYYRADAVLGVDERWSIHEVGEGGLLYRVDEDGREEDGLSILSEALVSPNGTFERFTVQSFSSRDPDVQLFKADYSFESDQVLIGRKLPKQEREYQEFPLLVDCEVYIKQTVYMGLTIISLLAKAGKSQVFSPQLLSMTETVVQKLLVEEVGAEAVSVGRKSVAARKFQLADDVFYWIDAQGIPVRREYTHDGASYRVELMNYAHR